MGNTELFTALVCVDFNVVRCNKGGSCLQERGVCSVCVDFKVDVLKGGVCLPCLC